MPVAATNKVDIVSWLIHVEHAWQTETKDHWANPSEHSFMREVLHESVHFWQAVGLPYFLRISFDAFKDFQRVRAEALTQQPDAPLPADQLELEPNRAYFMSYQRLGHRYGALSGADLIEGLARYWDLHLCGVRHALDRLVDEGKTTSADIDAAQRTYGPFFLVDELHYTDAALRYLFDVESAYYRAYKFTLDTVGREAFILFPVFGFLALSSGRMSVSTFQRWLQQYADAKPFAIPRGHFFDAWHQTFTAAYRWITESLQEPLYSSLTVYSNLRRKMVGWVLQTPLPQRFGLIAGHGVLDRYLNNYWQWMRAVHPDTADEDVELRLHPAFCLPGIPEHRDILQAQFHPPVILFADGKAWLDESNWGPHTPSLEENLVSFGAMLGATMALTGEFPPEALAVQCPHTTCPWHRSRLCWKVARFPDAPEDCPMPEMYRTQLNIDVPTDPAWEAGRDPRPIMQDRAPLLSMEIE